MSHSIWVKKMLLAMSDEDIKTRLRIVPPAVTGLHLMSAEAAAETLGAALKFLHEPNSQEIAAIKRIFDTAYVHALINYSDDKQFVLRANAPKLVVNEEPTTVMVTGEAGIGKTEMRKAVGRLIGLAGRHQAASSVPEMPVVGGVFLRVNTNAGLADVLNLVAAELGARTEFKRTSEKDIALARKLLYLHGCCFILVDELQFLTQSQTANTKIVNTLELLRKLGVPVFYIGNFSLGHKLLKRPHEDRQRYLVNPLIMLPMPHTSTDYIEMCMSFEKVTGGVFSVKTADDRKMLHWYTGGNGRATRILITEAYKAMRQRTSMLSAEAAQKTSISMGDLETAYISVGFTSFREDVEICRGQLITQKQERADLWCPFALPPELQNTQRELVQQISQAHLFKAELESAMTLPEKQAVKSIMKTFEVIPTEKSAPKPPRPKAPEKTAESLNAAYLKYMRKSVE